MPGFTDAFSATVLDAQIDDTDYIAWSEDGTSETSNLARTAVTSWNAATTADPSVKDNASEITSAGATAGCTITHFAVFSASTGGTQKTEWEALDASRTLTTNDALQAAAGDIDVTLS